MMKNMLMFIMVVFLCIPCITHAQDVFSGQRVQWLMEAERAKPELQKEICYPRCLVKSVCDPTSWQQWTMVPAGEPEELYARSFKAERGAIFDFGRHLTGYFTFRLKTLSRTQDAPVRIRFTFAEVPLELNAPFDPYPGTLSRAWLQDEIVTVMYPDEDITLSRRMACRYVKAELMGASADFDFALSGLRFMAQTSVCMKPVPLVSEQIPSCIHDIYDTSLETLKECMQTVYEDGPKRDRRLWIGDLYLEALTNAYTYKQFELTRRCLYLLAGLAANDGRLHANVFEYPVPHPQDGTFCMDYSLLYNLALSDYVNATSDTLTLRNLYPVIRMQLYHALSYVEKGCFNPLLHAPELWLFFDWCEGFDTHASIQGLLVLALNRSAELAGKIGHEQDAQNWERQARELKRVGRREYYRAQKGIVVSGKEEQLSYLSQAWMILSGVLSVEEGRKALTLVFNQEDAVCPRTPYAWHYVLEAAIKCGMYQEARELLVNYWGGMVDKKADTFWEVYDPVQPLLSPYGFAPVNSYCHAWSCTPAYFIQRYPEVFQY